MLKLLPVLCLLLMLSVVTDAKIVFQSNRADNQTYEIYVMDDDGSNLQRLTHNEVKDANPAWAPDSLHIVFSRESEDQKTSDLFLMNRDGDAPINLTNHPALHGTPSWSPDGQRIAFVSSRDTPQWNIFTIDILSQKVKRLTHNKQLEDGGADFPDFSPDGRHIVYTQSTPGRWRTLHLMRADGSGQHELIPSDGVLRTYPRWSPDGKKIAFSEIHYGPNLKLISSKTVIQNLDNRARSVLKTPRDWLPHAICWMGRKSILIAADGLNSPERQADIYRYHLATDEITNLTNSPGDDYAQDWISDTTYDVSGAHNKSILWGALKKTYMETDDESR